MRARATQEACHPTGRLEQRLGFVAVLLNRRAAAARTQCGLAALKGLAVGSMVQVVEWLVQTAKLTPHGKTDVPMLSEV